MGEPLVSVGIPITAEQPEHVELAIKSIFAQTVADWELLLVTNGCSLQLKELVATFRDPRVRILDQPQRRTLSANLNLIAREARGRFLFRMDGDDISHPRRLESQLRVLTSGTSSPDVTTSQMAVVDEMTQLRGISRKTEVPPRPELFLQGTPVAHATAAAKTEWFRRHPYDESLWRSQDFAFWIDAAHDSDIHVAQEVLYIYRIASGMDYSKYANSLVNGRRALRRHGRKVASPAKVAVALGRSHLKQVAALMFHLVGQQRILYQRRLTGNGMSNLQQTDLQEAIASARGARTDGTPS